MTLVPPAERFERYRLQEWLAFINSEIHAGLAPLFNTELPETAKAIFREKIFKRFDYLENALERNDHLMGKHFSVVDAYLFTVLGWCRFFDICLDPWPALAAYVERVGARPAVQAALDAESA